MEKTKRSFEPKGVEMLRQDILDLGTFVESLGGAFMQGPVGEVVSGVAVTTKESNPTSDSVLLVQVCLPIILNKVDSSDTSGKKWEVVWDEEALLSPKAQIEAMKASGGGGGWLSRVRVKWIGLLPMEVAPEEEEEVRQALEPMGCIPVFMDHNTLYDFREGYCRATLWPIFHNVVDVYGEIPTKWWVKGQQSDRWKAYTDANAKFSAAVVENWHEGDLVWLHVSSNTCCVGWWSADVSFLCLLPPFPTTQHTHPC